MPTTESPPRDAGVESRVRTEIERAIRRNIKGLEYITRPDPQVGLTPRDTLHARGTLRLHHYRPQASEVYRVPVLLVMSLVSKPYILDLTPGQSFVEFLLQRGFDVYMIDWGTPRSEDRRLRIEDYVEDFIPECISLVQKDSGEDDLSIVGYCMGGLLSVLYAALNPGGPVKNLACFTTPVNFQGMELFNLWTDKRYFDVDRVVDALGNVPPELLVAAFDMLRPASKVAGQVKLWDNMWNDDFVKSFRMFDRWANDQIPFPGECFRQVTKDLMWENKLINDEFSVGGKPVHLKEITVPFIHIMAEHDHIVPQAASAPLVELIGSEDKREVVLKGGHVSLVAGGNAVYRLWPQVDTWLSERSV